MRKIAVGLLVGLVDLSAVFHADALASRQVTPAALPVSIPVPTLAEMALGLTRGLPLGDLIANLPVLGEAASVLPVAGGTGAGPAALPVVGSPPAVDSLLPAVTGLVSQLTATSASCALPVGAGDTLGTVNGTLGGVTGIVGGLPLVGGLLGQTTGGGLLGSAIATVNGLVENAPLAGPIAAQVTC